MKLDSMFIIIFISNFRQIRELNLIQFLSSPFLLLFIVFTIREGMDFFGLTTIIGNPVIIALYPDPVPFIEGIKDLLP